MKLTLLEKPQQEIISLSEAKHYIRVDQDYDDGLINTFISATREAMETLLQKSIIKQKWLYQIDMKDILNANYGEKDFPDILGNSIKIPLPKPPVLKVEQVTVIYNNDKRKIVPHDVEIDDGFFVRIQVEFRSKIKSREITYYTGIAEISENIPYQLKLANLMLVADAYKNRFTYDSACFMPKSIEKLLTPFKRMRLV